jgi:tetratricopeptide (TPR) repeat protein
VTSIEQANWHPLTWLSHMLDWQLFGSWAGGHHLTSALLHTAGTVLLFWLLKRMTGAPWPSAAVAALFAVHPLHVESVAWVSERKDVLSTLFGLLALLCYVRYAERPGVGRYLWVAVLFAASLMCKPMLVTLPCVMLLLDYWPLRRYPLRIANCELRIQTAPARGLFKSAIRNPQSAISFARTTALRLILEKLPLFALVAASSIMAFITQRHGGAMKYAEQLPFLTRLANAPVVYVTYLGKTVWPTALALFYPYTERPVWQAVLATALLAAITAGVVWQIRRRPYLAVGWFWFVGMLVPVIGVVQVGKQAMADRFTYVPLVGIFVAVAWGLWEALKTWPHRSLALGSLAGASVAGCMILASTQVWMWKDSRAVYKNAINVTENNALAHVNLGMVYTMEQHHQEAIDEYIAGLRANPNDTVAHNNLALALAQRGEFETPMRHLLEAIRVDPTYGTAYGNLALMLARQGRFQEALPYFQDALRLQPESATVRVNMSDVLINLGRPEEALALCREAMSLDSANPFVYEALGAAQRALGHSEEAVASYREGLRLAPNNVNIRYNLAGVLANLKRFDEALAVLNEALRIQPNFVLTYRGIVTILGQQGKMDEAIAFLTEVVQRHPEWPDMAGRLAWILATDPAPERRNGPQAVALAERACTTSGGQNLLCLEALAAAYAEAGRFQDAVAAARKASDVARAQKLDTLADQIDTRGRLYEAGKPYRQSP